MPSKVKPQKALERIWFKWTQPHTKTDWQTRGELTFEKLVLEVPFPYLLQLTITEQLIGIQMQWKISQLKLLKQPSMY